MESEIDVLEDVVDINMDSSKIYDYVGKFLPTKVTIRTRIPAKWENNENNFRKLIWDRINTPKMNDCSCVMIKHFDCPGCLCST